MQNITLLINDLVGLNQQIIGIIVPVFIAYLLLFWLLVSIWVYFDARKRYESIIMAFLFALINFFPPFNFLILIFYLVIRPEVMYDDFDDWEAGGVNVPIVNFMGEDGIEMSFEMRIHPKRLGDSHKTKDMSVEIGWDKKDEKFRLIDRDELAKQVTGEDLSVSKPKKEYISTIANVFSNMSGKVKKEAVIFKDKLIENVKNMKKDKETDKKPSKLSKSNKNSSTHKDNKKSTNK